MKMDHLVIVSQHFPPDNSGNASRVHDTARHLVSEGWDVTVLAPPPAFPHGEFDQTWQRRLTQTNDGITVHRLWAYQPTAEDPSFVARLAYYILFPLHALLWLCFHHRSVDVIMTSSPPIFTGISGLPFSFIGRIPVFVDVRDLWIDASVGLGFISEDGILERFSRAYQRLVLTSANKVSVTTAELGHQLVEEYSIDSAKIFHLPNGVDADRFEPSDTEREPTIIYTGNVGHAQDLAACIEALEYMDHSEVTLRIVGDGDIRADLKSFAFDRGLENRVEFTGLVDREAIPSMLRSSMIGVAPLKDDETLEYAVPTKAYEYMASNLPVVATGTGELEQLIMDSGGGIIVDNDPLALAEAFDRILADEEYAKKIGEAGRQYITTHYSRRNIAKHLSRQLKEVVRDA